MAVTWKKIAYQDDLDSHASQHGVSGSDSVFPADPDADRILMWDNDPGELVWSAAGLGDVTAGANLTDHNIVRGDGGAKGIQTTGITIADTTNNVSGMGTLGCGTITSSGSLVIADAGYIGSASAPTAMQFSAAGNIGVGVAANAAIRLYFLAPDGQSTIFYGVYGDTQSDAAENIGVSGRATGDEGTTNIGVRGRAKYATNNYAFLSDEGDTKLCGTITLTGLAGTGTRAVVVDADGVLSAP